MIGSWGKIGIPLSILRMVCQSLIMSW